MLTAQRINTFLKYRVKSFPPSPLSHILTINHLNWLKNKMFIALTFKREGTKDGLRNLSDNWSSDVSIFHLIKWLCWCLSERSDVPCTHTLASPFLHYDMSGTPPTATQTTARSQLLGFTARLGGMTYSWSPCQMKIIHPFNHLPSRVFW